VERLNKTLLIGATGFLGSYLAEHYDVEIATTRFEDPKEDWLQYKNIDTVWLVARACRKESPRRDRKTKELEIKGIANIAQTFSDCHFHYTSTKCVYGLTDNDIREIDRSRIGFYMCNNLNGTHNLPFTTINKINLNPLGEEHKIYAKTKLACEEIIRTTVKSCSIWRIWDIVQ
jgi:nucleoside-diphosphate-sugar epimerase